MNRYNIWIMISEKIKYLMLSSLVFKILVSSKQGI